MYEELFEKPNVVGAGLGYMTKNGERYSEGVVVMVSRKLPLAALAPHEVIENEYHGIVTDVMEVGHLVAPKPITAQVVDRTGRVRPAPGGVSIGHYKITAGTLGCVCYDLLTGNTVILSNNHVLANSNGAEIGDRILQPGVYDSGDYDDDYIADLLRFIPIEFSSEPPTCPISEFVAGSANFLARAFGSSHQLKPIKTSQTVNKVDAAIAVPLDKKDVTTDILEIPGKIKAIQQPIIGMKVRKSGRTTGLTTNEILVVSATVTVNYGGDLYATFEDQFVTGPMSAGGDSGSLVLNQDELIAVGLLFAGSDQVTICNVIDNVFDALNLAF